jgi:hypothetical protein
MGKQNCNWKEYMNKPMGNSQELCNDDTWFKCVQVGKRSDTASLCPPRFLWSPLERVLRSKYFAHVREKDKQRYDKWN